MAYDETIKCVEEELNYTFDYLDAFFDLSEDRLQSRLNEHEWLISEILEHITLTSHFLMITLKQSLDKVIRRAKELPIPDDNTKLDRIIEISDPDAFDWIRPEHMQPTGQVSHADVRATMKQQKAECLEILGKIRNGEGNLHRVRMSVQNLGKLNMYEWMYFLIQHAKRHCVEIERICELHHIEFSKLK